MKIEKASAMVTGGGSGLVPLLLGYWRPRARESSCLIGTAFARAVADDIGGVAAVGDVSVEADAQAAVDAAEDLRICVNCAGIDPATRMVGRDGRSRSARSRRRSASA